MTSRKQGPEKYWKCREREREREWTAEQAMHDPQAMMLPLRYDCRQCRPQWVQRNLLVAIVSITIELVDQKTCTSTLQHAVMLI